MATKVDVESMMVEYQARPDLFSIRRSDELGIYLFFDGRSLNDKTFDHHSWRQNRIYMGKRFDISGVDDAPSSIVVALWNEIDLTFDAFRQHCIDLLRTHVEHELTSEPSPIIPRSCLECIRNSIDSGSIQIPEIALGKMGWYNVDLGYPEFDTYYLSPRICFNNHKVVEVEIIP